MLKVYENVRYYDGANGAGLEMNEETIARVLDDICFYGLTAVREGSSVLFWDQQDPPMCHFALHEPPAVRTPAPRAEVAQ